MYFYNGEFVAKEAVNISPDDRGYYFGDGVYEVFRIYGGQLFEVERHMQRLERSAAEIRLALPYDRSQIENIMDRLVAESKLTTGILYMQVTRGAAIRTHAFPENGQGIMLAYCSEAERPLQAMSEGIQAITTDDIRWLRCDLKTLNLLPNVLAKQKAVDHGVDEVILHRNGNVTECSASNLMIVKDGVLMTHPANHLILHGVTRAVVLDLARQADLDISEAPYTLEQLRTADEAFITGTTAEITPIIQIDGEPVGSGKPGTITRKLQHLFDQYAGL